MQFFMPMKKPPTTTHQMKQVSCVKGKPVFYEPDNVKEARALLNAHLAPHAPIEPIRGAVRLVTKWCWKANRRHQHGEYRTTKPDTDNIIKLLKDEMTALGFWEDDARVASETTEKFWSDFPGIYVNVEGIE